MIYPAITLFFAITVLFLFSKTIVFLTTNIDKVFSVNNASLAGAVPQLDLANYELIRKRFNWPELARASSTEALILPAAPSTATAVASTLAKNADTAQIISEKAAITIKIFNGPGGITAGDALQNELNQFNFTNSQIDSHQLVLKDTIIQFKSSSKNLKKYMEEIEKIISSKYPIQIGSDLPDSAEYDVSILIGKK